MDDARLSIPWYVTGKLDEAERRQIEALAAEDPEFANLIAEAGKEAEAAAAVNRELGEPSPEVWARIERSVEAERRERSRSWLTERIQALKASVTAYFGGFMLPQWQMAAAAAVAVCALEAGAIAYLSNKENPSFRVASGPQTQAGAKHAAFIVSFSDSASMAAVSKALDEAGAVIVGGPNEDRLYRLALRDDTMDARNRAHAKLEGSGLVTLILPEN
jgi:anti-sigma-K factor RskA